MRFGTYAILWLLILCTAIAGSIDWHTPPDKWQAPRLFHTPFDEQFGSRLSVDRCAIPEASPERHTAPNKAYWYALIRPDHTKDGPWNSEVLIYTERDHLVRLRDIRDCHEVRWVNEKLLFIRVWWGRICATDLILDVEREQIVYREMVWDGVIPFQQYQDAKTKSQRPNGSANGRQPFSSDTNRTSSAAGSRR